MTEEQGTFEVAPPEDIDGVPHKLVFTRVREQPTRFDGRVHALNAALNYHQHIYAWKSGEFGDEANLTPEKVVETAKLFEKFLGVETVAD